MPFETATLQSALFAGFAFCLIWAAVSDILSRKIANINCLTIAVLGMAFAATSGSHFISHFLTAFVVLTLGFLAYAKSWFGGGDAKLLAACALWVGPAGIAEFLFYTALTGGVMAILWLFEGTVRYAMVRGGMNVQLSITRELPYGLAIAVGGLVATASTGGF